jgi:hypothetical protein
MTVQYLADRDINNAISSPPHTSNVKHYYATVMNHQVRKSTGNFTIHGGGRKRKLERKTACSHLPTLPNISNMRPFTTSSTTSMNQGEDKYTRKCTQDCRETAVPYHPGSFLQGKGKNGKAVPVHTKKAYGGDEVQIHPFLNSALHRVRVQLHALPTIPTGKSYYSPTNRRLVRPQTQSVHFGDISCPCWELNHKSSVVQPKAQSLKQLR